MQLISFAEMELTFHLLVFNREDAEILAWS